MPPKKKRKAKTSLEDAFSSLSKALSEREKELDAREQQLRKDREQFETEYSSGYHGATPSDVLHLNIGGKTTTALRRTLTCVPGSMLASKFSGRWDDSIEKDKDGNFFIEENFILFNTMLNCIRNRAKGGGDDDYPCESPQGSNAFYRMLNHYGMTHAIYPIKLTGVRVDTRESPKIIGKKIVSTEKMVTVALMLDGHKRGVKSFEVTFGNVKRIQIGWHVDHAWDIEYGYMSWAIGYSDTNFTLDPLRSEFVFNNRRIRMIPLKYSESKGMVVRSEDYGALWYVNGERVTKPSEISVTGHTPFVWVQGDAEITRVELEAYPTKK